MSDGSEADQKIAESLDYSQRKALRRIGRGQSITRTMQRDPLMQAFHTTAHYEFPTPDMNIVEWCDAEYRALAQRPRLTDLGRRAIEALNKETP